MPALKKFRYAIQIAAWTTGLQSDPPWCIAIRLQSTARFGPNPPWHNPRLRNRHCERRSNRDPGFCKVATRQRPTRNVLSFSSLQYGLERLKLSVKLVFQNVCYMSWRAIYIRTRTTRARSKLIGRVINRLWVNGLPWSTSLTSSRARMRSAF